MDVEPFFWPQSFDDVDEMLWSNDDRKFLIMMNSNKLPAIDHEELYTERLRAISFFGARDEMDLYGVGWNKASLRLGRTWIPWTMRYLYGRALDVVDRISPDPRLVAARKVYRGRAESKKDTLARYTFAICFENSILRGWITEKIFDCFLTGTIPVYLGAPDITEHVPADCFIDMRRFDGYEELREHLKAMTDNRIREYREAARDFIRSEAFRPFSMQAFADLFMRMIEEDAARENSRVEPCTE
jgi:hypothetical protein